MRDGRTAGARGTRGVRSDGLLAAYTARNGDAIRRQQSVVALRAARMEAELAYKARGTFLAHMNHELRTPLNAIMGFAGLLKEADAYGFAEEQKAEYLGHILESSELLLSHINTLLEVADAESGGVRLSKCAFAPAEVIEDVTTGLATDLAPRGIAVRADVGDGLPDVHADPDRVATALRHVVRFASARGREASEVRVTARAGLTATASDWVYVAVEAEGDDRTDEDIREALDVFDRVRQGLHRGLGPELSLPIAKSFIELNGGRFNVKTRQGTAGGCLYRFALPRAVASDTVDRPLDLAAVSVAS